MQVKSFARFTSFISVNTLFYAGGTRSKEKVSEFCEKYGTKVGVFGKSCKQKNSTAPAWYTKSKNIYFVYMFDVTKMSKDELKLYQKIVKIWQKSS